MPAKLDTASVKDLCVLVPPLLHTFLLLQVCDNDSDSDRLPTRHLIQQSVVLLSDRGDSIGPDGGKTALKDLPWSNP